MMMLYPNGEDFFIMALTLHYLSMSIYKKKKKKFFFFKKSSESAPKFSGRSGNWKHSYFFIWPKTFVKNAIKEC